MKISQLIEELKKRKKEYGDIQVTCTHSLLPEGEDVFETTVETFRITNNPKIGKAVRLYL
jgi:hypothetical protein